MCVYGDGRCATCGSATRRFRGSGRQAKYCGECRNHGRTKECKRNCEQCGVWFESKHKRRYCGDKCRNSANYSKRRIEKPCEKCGKLIVAVTKTRFCGQECAHAARRNSGPLKSMRICVGCGISFRKKTSSRNAGKYHSRECAFANDLHYRRGVERKEARAIADGFLWWANHWRVCRVCDSQFWAEGRQIQCSDECRREYARLESRRIACRRTPSRPCKGCGKTLLRIPDKRKKQGSRLPTVCDACAAESKRLCRRNLKARRRAWKKNNGPHEAIKVIDVFKRDKWVCGICGMQTDKSARVPEPKAPTLDHVVPLAKGGTHTMDNVQCACFECNWMKSDAMVDDQPSLQNATC